MSLRIEQLELREFRGYTHLLLGGLAPLNVIAGPNAVGKTNIVEALQLLCSGTSFRKPSWSETVSWGADAARLSARFVDGKRLVEHALAIRGNERVYTVNGKRRSASAVSSTCPCVLFIPDDLQMVKASSAVRRAKIDELGAQLSKGYATLRGGFSQVLRQRNLLLRDGISDVALLASWNESLALHGARLCTARWRLFERLALLFARIYASLAPSERASVRFIPSWERFDGEGRQVKEPPSEPDGPMSPPEPERAEELLSELMVRHAAQEFRRKTSLFGPHKDEFAFFINGRNARLFASQGQQRTLVLAWKLAEVELVSEIAGQKPVLLLDDVMSELDAEHRDALARFVESSAQTFMTTANLGYFSEPLLEKAHLIEVPIAGTRHEYQA